jgi:hypothetical protein
MTALPDVKTANKVVELILKNASIAVTGHLARGRRRRAQPGQHQARPGQHHPEGGGLGRAHAAAGARRFDVSQLVLDDLRARIRHTLLTDRLGPVAGGR